MTTIGQPGGRERGYTYCDFSHVSATITTPRGMDLEACVETGSRMSLIDRETYSQYFPRCTERGLSPGIDIAGVNPGVDNITTFIESALEFNTLRHGTVRLAPAELHVKEGSFAEQGDLVKPYIYQLEIHYHRHLIYNSHSNLVAQEDDQRYS